MKSLLLPICIAIIICSIACKKTDDNTNNNNNGNNKPPATDFREKYTGNFILKDSRKDTYYPEGAPSYVIDTFYDYTATVIYQITDSILTYYPSPDQKKIPALKFITGSDTILVLGIDTMGKLYQTFYPSTENKGSFIGIDSFSFNAKSYSGHATWSDTWTGHRIP